VDKIDGSKYNHQRIQTDWFDFKKVQAEEQLKLTSTVQSKPANVKAELQNPEQRQLAPFQSTRSPFQEVDNASSGLQKLLEFSTMSNSATVPAQTDLDLDAIISSMKNQFQMQTFSGKEFETLRNLLKQNPTNLLMKNAIAAVLRAFSALQTANAAQNTMENAIDDLLVMLKDDKFSQTYIGGQGKLDNQVGDSLSNLISRSSSILKQQKNYVTYSSTLKDFLIQIQDTVPKESSINNMIERILSAMKRLDDAQSFDLNDAVEKLLNLSGKTQPGTPDKLVNLLQKAIGIGATEGKSGRSIATQDMQSTNLAQELTEKANLMPVKNELEDAISVINQLKKQYPQSHVVQTLSAQTLSGLTANLLANQPMLHFFLKSILNDSPQIADVWIDPENEEGSEKMIKVLLTVDLEKSDSFEVELKLSGKMLSAKVSCPDSYVDDMQGIKKVIREQANGLGYSVPHLSVGVLTEKHSLEEIFAKDCDGRGSFNARI
jgi:hypothetical protein